MNLTTIVPSAEILVQQCINGDHTAYKLLYDRYSKAMFNTALRMLNRTADAEDILQEAFTDAFQQLENFRGKSTFGAWLKQIVVYKCITHLKKQRLLFSDMEPDADTLPDEPPLHEDEIWYTVEIIKGAMQSLPTGYRTVLSLHLFEGYDQEEVAEIMQVTHSTVRTQYMRAKQKLLQVLKQHELYER